MIKKYFQTINQELFLSYTPWNVLLDVDLNVAGELISRVILTEFGQIIKFMYIYTHLNIRSVSIFADHAADIVIIFGTSHRYKNNNEIIP